MTDENKGCDQGDDIAEALSNNDFISAGAVRKAELDATDAEAQLIANNATDTKRLTPEQEKFARRLEMIAAFAQVGIDFLAFEEAMGLVPDLKARVEVLERKLEHHGIVGPR